MTLPLKVLNRKVPFPPPPRSAFRFRRLEVCSVSGTSEFSRPLKELKIPSPQVKYADMHGALREMLAFLRTGKTPQTECHDNIKSLAMVFAAIESSRKGRRVPVRGL